MDALSGLARSIPFDDSASVLDVYDEKQGLMLPTNSYPCLLASADLNVKIYLIRKTVEIRMNKGSVGQNVFTICL